MSERVPGAPRQGGSRGASLGGKTREGRLLRDAPRTRRRGHPRRDSNRRRRRLTARSCPSPSPRRRGWDSNRRAVHRGSRRGDARGSLPRVCGRRRASTKGRASRESPRRRGRLPRTPPRARRERQVAVERDARRVRGRSARGGVRRGGSPGDVRVVVASTSRRGNRRRRDGAGRAATRRTPQSRGVRGAFGRETSRRVDAASSSVATVRGDAARGRARVRTRGDERVGVEAQGTVRRRAGGDGTRRRGGSSRDRGGGARHRVRHR